MPATVLLRLRCPHWPSASRRASLLRVRRRGAWRAADVVQTQRTAGNISTSSRSRPAAHQLNSCEARGTLQLAAVGHYQDRISHAQAPPSETGSLSTDRLPPDPRPSPQTSPIHPLSAWAKIPIRRKPETSSPAKMALNQITRGQRQTPPLPNPGINTKTTRISMGEGSQGTKSKESVRRRELSPADLT